MFKKSLNVNDAWFGFYSHFKKGTLHVHMNNFKIPRQKYSTNMATGSYVTSRENDLISVFSRFLLPPSHTFHFLLKQLMKQFFFFKCHYFIILHNMMKILKMNNSLVIP